MTEHGFKLVRVDLTTDDHQGGRYRWTPGQWHDADPGDRDFTPIGACPSFPGDGLCVARDLPGAQSGGQRVGSSTMLLCEWEPGDVLFDGGSKVRVRRLFVSELVDPVELIKWAAATGADLRGADLGDADLRGADLRGADLGDAYLRGAYLRGADLGGAYLGGADLGDAYLGGAYLGGAYLGDAYLRGAYLRGADLGDAYLGGAYLGDAYLRGAYLRGADLGDADLGDAYLRGAYLRGAVGYQLPAGWTVTEQGYVVAS